MKKIMLIVSMILLIGSLLAQATLPFTYDGGSPSEVTGLTANGLGSYSASPKMKFDGTGDYLILNFNSNPGTLTFDLKWNQSTAAPRFPGNFELQESSDGINYTTVQLYDSINGTALPNGTVISETFSTFSTNTRFIKWIYTSKSNGNIALGNLSLTAAGASNAPSITNITSITTPPLANEDSNISATVTDADGQDNINQVKIAYTINSGATQYIIINNSIGEPTIYAGNIPASAYNDGDLVEYWIIATDSDDPVHTTESAHYKFFAGISPISTIRALDANNYPVYNNIVCRISGIALNNDGTFNPTTYNDAFIQDATGGLDAFKSSQLTEFNFTEGHSYTLIGTITHYNGKFEIVLTSATDNGFIGLPNIMIVTISQLLADPEYYEGRYIGVMNVNKTSGTWPTTNAHATLVVNDGSSDGSLYINKNTGCYLENEPVWPKDIKGIFSQFDSSSPYDSGYQILVRSINDFVNAGTLPVTFSAFDAVLTASNTVSLQWTTQTESNVYGYYIFRSTSNTTTNAERVSALIPATNTSSEHSYEYQDVEIESNQTYYYWITSYELNGHTEWYGPKSVTTNNPNIVPTLPSTTTLVKTYPNPFNTNQTQSIEVKVRDTETATLSIYNIKGQNVKTYNNLTPGTHNLTWNAKDNQNNSCASGIYFYKLTSPTTTVMKKVMIVK